MSVYVSVDDSFELYADGVFKGAGDKWHKTYKFDIPINTEVIAILAEDNGWPFGILGSAKYFKTDSSWICADFTSGIPSGWTSPGYDDPGWSYAQVYTEDLDSSRKKIDSTAQWIWFANGYGLSKAGCRKHLADFMNTGDSNA